MSFFVMKYRWTLAEGFILDVEPIEFGQLTQFRTQAKKAGLSFKVSQNTTWLAGRIDGEIVSFAAIVRFGPHLEKARMKAAYTLPEWRGIGVGTAMAETRLDWSLWLGTEYWEVFTEDPDFFLLRGFQHASGTKYNRTTDSRVPVTLYGQPQAGPVLLERET
jgi:GNAT superfamily N-acetyltransferase